MKPHVSLIRAIACEFVSRKLKAVTIVIGIITTVVLVFAIWLTTISVWWWLLAIPIIGFMLLGILVYIAARLIIKKTRPQLTDVQAKGVTAFVDKLERVADNLQTPVFIIVFRLVRDTARPRHKTFVQALAEDSTTLHKDFLELQRNFS